MSTSKLMTVERFTETLTAGKYASRATARRSVGRTHLSFNEKEGLKKKVDEYFAAPKKVTKKPKKKGPGYFKTLHAEPFCLVFHRVASDKELTNNSLVLCASAVDAQMTLPELCSALKKVQS